MRMSAYFSKLIILNEVIENEKEFGSNVRLARCDKFSFICDCGYLFAAGISRIRLVNAGGKRSQCGKCAVACTVE